MTRQQRRRRRAVPAEIHEHPGAFLDWVFGRHVTAVVRDRAGRWGVVLDGGELVWAGHEREIVQFDRTGRWLIQEGYKPAGWRPPSLSFGRWLHGALRRVYNMQRERQ